VIKITQRHAPATTGWPDDSNNFPAPHDFEAFTSVPHPAQNVR
jgi:hypothetical protein